MDKPRELVKLGWKKRHRMLELGPPRRHIKTFIEQPCCLETPLVPLPPTENIERVKKELEDLAKSLNLL